MSEQKPQFSVWQAVKPFLNGGLAGMMATTIIQPIDMVKVRIQLGATGGPLTVAKDIVAKDGFGALYNGLSAGLVRQATYTTARLGIFQVINAEAIKRNEGKPLPLYQKAICGLTAGGLGALVGTPADLSLIRMQADATLPAAERRNYKGVLDAFSRIVKDEGVGGLFRGAGPTIARAMALNMGMFAANEQAKEMLHSAGLQGLTLTASASMVAGFFASACSLPFDFVKTRVQKMKPDPATGKLPYSGFLDCFMQTLTKEGPLKFYTGFPTYYIRIAPHVALTLIFASELKKVQEAYGL